MRNINQNVNSHALMAASALNRTSGLCECVLLAIPVAAARVHGPGGFTPETDAARAHAWLQWTWHIAQYMYLKFAQFACCCATIVMPSRWPRTTDG